MHRLAATPGGWNPDTEGVIFIEQTPAPLVFLTAADTDIQSLAKVLCQLPPDFPQLRVTNLLQLQQALTIDTYAEEVLTQAQVIVVRLLGGRAYWSYGLEVVKETVERTGASLITLPGDDRPDPDLMSHSTVSLNIANQLWRYLTEGGLENIKHGLEWVSDRCLGSQFKPPPPQTVPRVGPYSREKVVGKKLPKVGVLFYRAHYLAGNTAPIDALCAALTEKGLTPAPIFVASLQDPEVQAELLAYLQPQDGDAIEVLLNTTSFSVAKLDAATPNLSLWQTLDVPILQVIFSGGTEEQWRTHPQGLAPRDIAMNIALPEVDGRIISRAVSFKAVRSRDANLETDIVGYEPRRDRIQFAANLAANWVKLRQTPPSERRLALILANYPTRNGRLANGVGLDTPASCVEILNALKQAGYSVENSPQSGDELIHRLTTHLTNDPESRALCRANQSLPLADYLQYFQTLPQAVQQSVCDRWGEPEFRIQNSEFRIQEPEDRSQESKVNSSPPSPPACLPLPGLQLGNLFIGIQPARGYDQDPALNYHAPDLEPTHDYLAFYHWIREYFGAHAIVHLGKHGNLEWLPGKAVALSTTCYPEVALGPLPHLYPFIVNDPGEGAQAKRRTQAIILDHLTPPMTRAELYGPLQQLEHLVDEYYEAQSLDPRRLSAIRDRITALIIQENLHQDLEIGVGGAGGARGARGAGGAGGENSDKTQSKILSGAERSLASSLPDKAIAPRAINPNPQISSLSSASPASPFPPASPSPPLSPASPASPTHLPLETLLPQIDSYLCELKEAQIRDGLHIFGQCPQGRQLRDLVIAIARHPSAERLGLTRAIAQDWGLDLDPLTADAAASFPQPNSSLETLQPTSLRKCRTAGDVIEVLENHAAHLVEILINSPQPSPSTHSSIPPKTPSSKIQNPKSKIQNPKSKIQNPPPPPLPPSPPPLTQTELSWIQTHLLPALRQTNQEMTHLLKGLDGCYVPSGPSGAPTRNRPEALPTGRNFYSVDIRAIPTESAWDVGRKAAEVLIEHYVQENGEYPKTLGLSVWGTSTMRTGGDDLAEALALLGVMPIWDGPSRRVVGFEILSVSVLGRPRVDVTLRISGFFRDAFPNLIDLFDRAIEAVSALDESSDQNPLAAQVRQESQFWQAEGLSPKQAVQRSRYRIFGSKPGAYGAGLQGLIEAQNWTDDQDLARAYINWSSYAYTRQAEGRSAPEAFQQRLQQMQVVLHNQDNREHDLLDSDDYYQFQGGLTAAARAVTGQNPQTYFGDHAIPENPKVRKLQAEIARVYRSRVVNPKWIEGVMRHGYKGAFEMAATVDYLFAYDATTHCVTDPMYQGITNAYLFDQRVREFIQQKNPWALRDIAERLLEAYQRKLWQNVDSETLDNLKMRVNEAEGLIENRQSSPNLL